jgi:hypothetical protein
MSSENECSLTPRLCRFNALVNVTDAPKTNGPRLRYNTVRLGVGRSLRKPADRTFREKTTLGAFREILVVEVARLKVFPVSCLAEKAADRW